VSDRVEKEDAQPKPDVEAKLEAIRKAVEYSFPTGDTEGLLAEIEHGREL
jgi:hypothetical protein